MTQLLKQVLLICFCLFALTEQVIADSLSDARRAYDEGNYSEAVKLFIPVAQKGDAQAQTHLGRIYYYGQGVPEDYTEALKWLRLAAAQGDAQAQGNLGMMHYNGQGTPQDYQEALKWYRLAAENGDSAAQNNLAHMYADKKIVSKDLKAALYWLEKAVLAGVPNAQTSLGWAYMSDYMGLAPDYQLAMMWNLKASNQGFGEGSANIGLLYENGWGVPVNYLEAATWYTKAIDQRGRSGQAELQLGGLYENGLGLKTNLKEAANLYRTVVEQYGDGGFANEAQSRLTSMPSYQHATLNETACCALAGCYQIDRRGVSEHATPRFIRSGLSRQSAWRMLAKTDL